MSLPPHSAHRPKPILKSRPISTAKKVRFNSSLPTADHRVIWQASPDLEADAAKPTVKKGSRKKNRGCDSQNRECDLESNPYVLVHEEFEVEAILDHKKVDGEYVYLLKWKGYSDEDNTWEPSSNLFCTELLNAYRKKHGLNSAKDPTLQVSTSQSNDPKPLEKAEPLEKAAQLEKVDRRKMSLSLGESTKQSFKENHKSSTESSFSSPLSEESVEWSIQATSLQKKLDRWKQRKDRKVKELKVSIGLSSINLPVHKDKSKKIYRPLTCSPANNMDISHRLLCYKHDHPYCHPSFMLTPVLDDTNQQTNFPYSHDCVAHRPSSPFCSPTSSPNVYKVELSPHSFLLPPNNDDISELYDNDISEIHDDNDSEHTDTASDVSNYDSDHIRESPIIVSDDSRSNSPIPSLINHDSDSLKLYLSPTSSVSESDGEELFRHQRSKDYVNCFPKGEMPPYTVMHNGVLSSHKGSKIGRRWRGPIPLPRSFSGRFPMSSHLQTKAAKLHFPEVLLSRDPMRFKPYENGKHLSHITEQFVRLNGSNCCQKLSCSHSNPKSQPVNSMRKNNLSSSNDENHLEQITESHPDEEHYPILKIDDLKSLQHYAYMDILTNWQYELNKQRDGTDYFIYVENVVDKVPPPSDFNYICSNTYSEGVPNPSSAEIANSLCGCECYYLGRKCGPKSEFCCAHMAGSKFAYTQAGKVRVPPGTPIYECNAKCSCPSDCTNRIVQLGRKIPLCIFRTRGKGWGVKTIEPIKPNTFVTEYVGEVITNEEAEKRGKLYDAQGITYLFDLDFEDENSAFTIDAAKYGNISHFFNHSCDPNLVVYSVWIDTLDKRLPRLAFFTTRSISIGEELTFDYQMNYNRDSTSGSGAKIQCLCGSKNCLGYIDGVASNSTS